jgi:integrase
MLGGKRYRGTFDTASSGERWETDVRHAISTGRPIPQANTAGRVSGGKLVTLHQVANYTLKHNYADHDDYRVKVERYVKQMEEHFGANAMMSSIKRPEIDAYIAFLRETGNSNGTINRKTSALSSIFKTAKSLDVCDRPSWPKRLKESSGKLRFVYPHEEKAILAKALEFQDQDLHDIIVFALDTGARFSSIVTAKWGWFSPELTSWVLWKIKTDNPMGMPLTKRCQEMLKRRRSAKGGPFVHEKHSSVRYRLERVLGNIEGMDLDDITFHTFRHTTASRLVQRGVDLRRVQMWMGHKAIATTIRYAKLAPNDLADMANVLEAPAKVRQTEDA